MSVSQLIANANHRTSLMNQKRFAKKTFVKKTEVELIDMLCERATDVAEAFYRGKGDIRDALKDLQQAVSVAQKCTREMRK